MFLSVQGSWNEDRDTRTSKKVTGKKREKKVPFRLASVLPVRRCQKEKDKRKKTKVKRLEQGSNLRVFRHGISWIT